MKILGIVGALIGATGSAYAAGIDRSGQDISALFESGNYIELSYGRVVPKVSGSLAGGLMQSGNMARAYDQYGGAFKMDVNDKVSLALIFDTPYGASISYDRNTYAVGGTNAQIHSSGITALAKYRFNQNFSVYGGLSLITADANVTLARGGVPRYKADIRSAQGTGYVIGAAYERPEIALRAALTYRSEIDMSHDTSFAGGALVLPDSTKYTLPASVNLDLQTGIAANTLLMANVRWVDWTKLDINGPNPANPSAPVDLVDYSNDSVSYSIGIGHRFNDRLSGSFKIGYEASQGGLASNLSPTDGRISYTVGAKYKITDNSAISFGASYANLGNATTETIRASFKDNSVFGVGIKFSTTF